MSLCAPVGAAPWQTTAHASTFTQPDAGSGELSASFKVSDRVPGTARTPSWPSAPHLSPSTRTRSAAANEQSSSAIREASG